MKNCTFFSVNIFASTLHSDAQCKIFYVKQKTRMALSDFKIVVGETAKTIFHFLNIKALLHQIPRPHNQTKGSFQRELCANII